MSNWPIFDEPSKVFPLYSRANVGEIFPDPISPLNASAGFQHCLETGWRAAFVACGVWDQDLYDRSVEKNILPGFGSYLYINMSLMRLFGVRVPGMSAEAVDLQYFGDLPGIPSYESERRDFDDDPAFSEKAGAWLQEQVLGATDLAAYDTDKAEVDRIRASRPNLAQLTDAQLRERIVSFEDLLVRLLQHHIEASLKSGVGLGAIAQFTAAIGKPEIALTLVSGIGDVDSTGPSVDMYRLSRAAQDRAVAALFDQGVDGLYERLEASAEPSVIGFTSSLDEFLATWDFRGPSEWEIHADTWGVRPEIALAAIERMRRAGADADPTVGGGRRVAERDATVAAVREALAGNDEAAGQFEAILGAAALWLRGRERGRTTAAKVIHEIRLAGLELGRRAVERGDIADAHDIFMLFENELDAFLADPAPFGPTLAERKRIYVGLFDIVPPFVVAGDVPPVEEWERRSSISAESIEVGESIAGVPGSSGVARGRARVVLNADEVDELDQGEVLIAPITDPSWTPLFVGAAAVIVDVGAPFSHAAIVSRELGIPCVVSVGKATKRIRTGDLVEVDGTAGTVRLLEREPVPVG
ncbi:PEP-utilizing enzyme [uncultured Microbacterium sp.]|uniref:PEP-utilizing enzyme n=1 Tax=uncultured Microbacterium sp. TaxID=191216 RepID=UPI0035CBD9AC